jgi:hypothetical protein
MGGARLSMKTITMQVSVIVLLSSLPGWANVEKSTATVSDVSSPQQIASFSGTVSLSQESQGTSAMRRFKEEGAVGVRNISGKTIIALAVIVKTALTEIRYNHDFFFKDYGLAPGETLGIPVGDGLTVTFDATNLRERADSELKFVQFDDGTTWGDNAVLESLKADRAGTELYLRGLLQAYADQGEKGLVSVLQTRPKGGAYNDYQRLIHLQKESGTAATLEAIRSRLKIAEERDATGKF